MNGAASPAMAAGSEKSAAHRLGLSHSTVKHHLANARTKVGAETTAQLVWVLAARLPEPKDIAHPDACARKTVAELTLERSDSDGGVPMEPCRRVRKDKRGVGGSAGGRRGAAAPADRQGHEGGSTCPSTECSGWRSAARCAGDRGAREGAVLMSGWSGREE